MNQIDQIEDIFHGIGGVPRRIVFDNASGVGRRVRDKISLNGLFLRFKCHYGFSVSFCNPEAGHEKGHLRSGKAERHPTFPNNGIVPRSFHFLGRGGNGC